MNDKDNTSPKNAMPFNKKLAAQFLQECRDYYAQKYGDTDPATILAARAAKAENEQSSEREEKSSDS